MKEEFVKEIKITDIKPCWTEPGKGRIFVEAKTTQVGEDIWGDLMPIIFLKYPPGLTVYNEQTNALTLKLYKRGIGIFPSGMVTMHNTKDEEEAKEILEEIRGILNEAHSYLIEKGRVSDDLIRKRIEISKISPLGIIKCLPNIGGCRMCGELTCTAFAFKLLREEVKLDDCGMLKEEKYLQKKIKLERMLGVINEK